MYGGRAVLGSRIAACFCIRGTPSWPGRSAVAGSAGSAASARAFTNCRGAISSIPYAPIEVLSADQIETIHRASLRILAGTRHRLLVTGSPRYSRRRRRRGGSQEPGCSLRPTTDRRACGDGAIALPSCTHAIPPTISAFGDNNINFSTVASAPNASDLQGGRRPGCYRDYCDFSAPWLKHLNVRCICFVVIRWSQWICRRRTRHLDCTDAFIRLSRQGVSSPTPSVVSRILDGIEMTRIARGISREQMLHEPSSANQSSIRVRRCASTARCWRGSSRWRATIRSWC